ncbi:putative glucan endo-1,3-beta-glucosidase GVI [Zingiber officinale]|uniref:putative glucan endo-1,3-beta-glucosidase GVI n=1 Tax=Zingiber officinale TaxID=94328 RepID=UPI001C4B1C49|nr:putative glucan endo-1,3-beta-glucosidase GVI [Zingiber officinale]
MANLVVFFLMIFTILINFCCRSEAQAAAVGVNYGLLGDNLPSTEQVVALCASRGIGRLRLFHPDEAVLGALRGSGIEVVLGTFNEELPGLASDPSAAENWVAANVVPFAGSVRFRYINAGNEVIPGDNAGYVLPAIRNLDAALRAAGLQIPVTTAVATMVLGVSYPPSQGAFSEAAAGVMAPIAAFLRSTSAPLLVNAYPYFSYARNEVALDYALFKAAGAPVIDGTLVYDNLFDAMVDAVYAALEKVGAPEVGVVVSETGWPSGGEGLGATVENAAAYVNNAVAHLEKGGGTPRRPGTATEAYLFAMFNENLKPAGTERYFGLFQPDMTEVYHVNFHL